MERSKHLRRGINDRQTGMETGGPGTFALGFGAILGEAALMCLAVNVKSHRYVAQSGEGAADAPPRRGQSIPEQIEMTQTSEVTVVINICGRSHLSKSGKGSVKKWKVIFYHKVAGDTLLNSGR